MAIEEGMNNYCSIIMTTFRTEKNNRKEIATDSIESLLTIAAGYPFEFILIDNTQNNRGLGAARNLGISMATGKYIAIIDDDIIFNTGWLIDCISIINKFNSGLWNEFIVATPIHSDKHRSWWKKHYLGQFEGYDWHTRSGSNCMVMTRKTFDYIGHFDEELPVNKVGVEWHDRLNKKVARYY